jgi:predicted metal-dependent HD superfamily phosphohydrolase
MTDDSLAGRWPLPDHHAERDALLAAYDDPARGYHDLLHLTEVLDRIDELEDSADGPATTVLRLAAWFHDAVYDGLRGDEDRSAMWAEDALADTPHAAEVARLVRVTEHHDPGYVAGVRRDYAHISDADFAIGRAAVLRDLTARDRLFHTAYARDHWEPAARANLTAELAALDGPQV